MRNLFHTLCFLFSFLYLSYPATALNEYSIHHENLNLCKKIKEHLSNSRKALAQQEAQTIKTPTKLMKWYLVRIEFIVSPQVYVEIPSLIKFNIGPSIGMQFVRRIPYGDEIF